MIAAAATLFLLVGTTSAGTPYKTVQVLTDLNFDSSINDPANGFWLLKFYAPWCGHCKKMAPMLDQVAVYLEGKMAIGKIDCTREKKVCKRFDVRGYPTLLVTRDGDMFPYPGERHADAIIEFAETMSANPVTLVQSYEEALDTLADKPPVSGVAFLAYHPSLTVDGDDYSMEQLLHSTHLTQVFAQIARKEQAAGSFGLLIPPPDSKMETLAKFVGTSVDTSNGFIVKIESGFEGRLYEGPLDETFTSPDMLLFLRQNNLAVVTALGGHNFKALSGKGKPLLIGVVPESTLGKDPLVDELKDFARVGSKDLVDAYNFCYMDGIKWGKFLSQFGVNRDNLPELLILNLHNRTYWHDSTVSGVQEFLEKVASEEIVMQHQGDALADADWFTKGQAFFLRYLPWTLLIPIAFFAFIIVVILPLGYNGDDSIDSEIKRKVVNPEKSKKTPSNEVTTTTTEAKKDK